MINSNASTARPEIIIRPAYEDYYRRIQELGVFKDASNLNNHDPRGSRRLVWPALNIRLIRRRRSSQGYGFKLSIRVRVVQYDRSKLLVFMVIGQR